MTFGHSMDTEFQSSWINVIKFLSGVFYIIIQNSYHIDCFREKPVGKSGMLIDKAG